MSACLSGSVPFYAIGSNKDQFIEEILWYKEVFHEDYYLELQCHEMDEKDLEIDGILKEPWIYKEYKDFISKQNIANKMIIEAASDLKIKCVATNDSHYIERYEWKAHEILINIQSGEPCEVWEKDSYGVNKKKILNPKRRIYASHEMYFKSPSQMAQLFHHIPSAIETTLEVADKCNVKLDFNTKHYPVFYPPNFNPGENPVEQRSNAVEKYLRTLCEEAIPKRYTKKKLHYVKERYPDKNPMDIVKKRLNEELEVIISKDLEDYLLIVYDFIRWARENNIPVGPGRGSGAGSIVLYLISVTDIEPLRFNLFFERFINPERMSYPDIDVDICMEGRNAVIEYTLNKYGKDNVAQIITFGTMKAKMAVKDVGRVLGVPLNKVNTIAKLIPEELNMTIDKALNIDTDLKKMCQEDEETRLILDYGKTLEGSIRNIGTHAAGVIICGEPLTNYIPVCLTKDAEIAVSQYSMKPVESVGMLKIDFLGLKTLTCIQKALKSIKKNHNIDIDWENLPLDDKKTFDLFNTGKTLGIFQLESSGMQDLALNLHLDKFEEIIAVISLYRPGPMDMIPSYINRKHGREKITYDHPWLENILSETYGIMVYQEQVMQIASTLANFSLGEGDVLRRAMGKKDIKQMATQREKFRDGALKNGIDTKPL